jgi:hypothetical protein
VRVDAAKTADEGIDLVPGGVSSSIPEPSRASCPTPTTSIAPAFPTARSQVVSLHLYGRNMDSFHIYDLDRDRTRVNVAHNS